MKIGSNLDSKQLDTLNRAANGSRTPTAPTGNVGGVQPIDKVQLSATSQSLAATEQATAAMRAEKVAEVRAAIEQGRFHVSAQVVADRMITAASELVETMATGRGARA
jgi:flagellar biosynthesis anti-sigma factor FlgM